MKIKLLPEEERPLEKAMKYGVSTLTNPELLAVLIRTGTKESSAIRLAEEIISSCDGGIRGLGMCTPQELMDVKGVGKAKACSIMAAVELGRRTAAKQPKQIHSIQSADDAAYYMMEKLRYEKKEHFRSIMLNAKGHIIAVENVSTGELSSTIVHPREAFTQAVKRSAAAVIFIHNHPSGDPTPSEEDFATTKRLINAGKILGIRVLDHIVIGDGVYRSMKAMGVLDNI